VNPPPPEDDLTLEIGDPIDSQSLDLEQPPSQQGKIYEAQRRQATWAFNICVAFAVLGIFKYLWESGLLCLGVITAELPLQPAYLRQAGFLEVCSIGARGLTKAPTGSLIA
jgi:hypothetical protein